MTYNNYNRYYTIECNLSSKYIIIYNKQNTENETSVEMWHHVYENKKKKIVYF